MKHRSYSMSGHRSLFLLLAALFLYCFPAKSQEPPKERIMTFLKKVADKGMPMDKIIRDYVCISTPEMVGNEKEQRAGVLNTLEFLRKELQTKNLRKTQVIPYQDVPEAQKNVKIEDVLVSDLYRVAFSEKESINVLLDGDRVVSCMTMTKGADQGFLLLFCTPSKLPKPQHLFPDTTRKQ